MSVHLTKLEVKNFRSLQHIGLDLTGLTLMYGPNGSGKSTVLDTIWFLRDCMIKDVETASSNRNHGVGSLWYGASDDEFIEIALETELARYAVSFGYSSGRIEPFVGEKLTSLNDGKVLIDRKRGSRQATFWHNGMGTAMQDVSLKEPEKLSFLQYMFVEPETHEAAADIDQLLRYTTLYKVRSQNVWSIQRHGTDANYHTHLSDRGQNLWSVLRNIASRRSVDDRYETIISYMQKGFPHTFRELTLDATSPTTVYGSFVLQNIQEPIPASSVSDGHIQMLLHLTALFSDGADKHGLIMFDEPETSLHPHTQRVLSEAMKTAVSKWNKQVIVATHAPMLINHFAVDQSYVLNLTDEGATVAQRVSEITSIADLLDRYQAGYLYLTDILGRQTK